MRSKHVDWGVAVRRGTSVASLRRRRRRGLGRARRRRVCRRHAGVLAAGVEVQAGVFLDGAQVAADGAGYQHRQCVFPWPCRRGSGAAREKWRQRGVRRDEHSWRKKEEITNERKRGREEERKRGRDAVAETTQTTETTSQHTVNSARGRKPRQVRQPTRQCSHPLHFPLKTNTHTHKHTQLSNQTHTHTTQCKHSNIKHTLHTHTHVHKDEQKGRTAIQP